MKQVLTKKELGEIVAAHMKAKGIRVRKVGFHAYYTTTPGTPARNPGDRPSVAEEIMGPALVHPTVKTTDITCEVEVCE